MSNVQADEEAIKALRESLVTFAGRQGEALVATEREIAETQRALDEAEAYWRRELERRRASLQQCLLAAAYAADEGGSVDCSEYQYAHRETEERIARILECKRRVREAVDAFRPAAQKYKSFLDGEVPRASAFLDNRFAALEAYLAAQASSSTAAPTGGGSQGASGSQSIRPGWHPPGHIEDKDSGGAGPERRG